MRIRSAVSCLLAACLLLLPAGCRRDEGAPAFNTATGAREPAQAVLLLTAHLRRHDLAAFARDAVPPALHARLDVAWRAGRTRWPLDELPFDERLPTLLGALAAPGSEGRLLQVFDRQFSGEHAELKAAATALGLFGSQYVRHEGDFSTAERAHYVQFVQALSRWAARAPLGDPKRARQAIPQLVAAARATGLRSDADFARIGMAGSLQRLSGFLAALDVVLGGYGLRLDDSLGGLRAQTVSHDGDHARVRMRYRLGDDPVDAVVGVRRIGGRWYLDDYVRHAEAAVASRRDDLPSPRPLITQGARDKTR